MLAVLISLRVFFACLVAYQDFRYRLIWVWTIVVYFLLHFFLFFYEDGSFEQLLWSMLAAVLYVFACGIGIFIYAIIAKKSINFIFTNVGGGDLLLALIIGTFLGYDRIIGFFAFALLASVAGSILFSKDKGIPLAGMLSLFFELYLVAQYFN